MISVVATEERDAGTFSSADGRVIQIYQSVPTKVTFVPSDRLRELAAASEMVGNTAHAEELRVIADGLEALALSVSR